LNNIAVIKDNQKNRKMSEQEQQAYLRGVGDGLEEARGEFDGAFQQAREQGKIEGAAEMGHRFQKTIRQFQEIIKVQNEKILAVADETIRLINDDIERTKEGSEGE